MAALWADEARRRGEYSSGAAPAETRKDGQTSGDPHRDGALAVARTVHRGARVTEEPR